MSAAFPDVTGDVDDIVPGYLLPVRFPWIYGIDLVWLMQTLYDFRTIVTGSKPSEKPNFVKKLDEGQLMRVGDSFDSLVYGDRHVMWAKSGVILPYSNRCGFVRDESLVKPCFEDVLGALNYYGALDESIKTVAEAGLSYDARLKADIVRHLVETVGKMNRRVYNGNAGGLYHVVAADSKPWDGYVHSRETVTFPSGNRQVSEVENNTLFHKYESVDYRGGKTTNVYDFLNFATLHSELPGGWFKQTSLWQRRTNGSTVGMVSWSHLYLVLRLYYRRWISHASGESEVDERYYTGICGCAALYATSPIQLLTVVQQVESGIGELGLDLTCPTTEYGDSGGVDCHAEIESIGGVASLNV